MGDVLPLQVRAATSRQAEEGNGNNMGCFLALHFTRPLLRETSSGVQRTLEKPHMQRDPAR
jgi:hypothetical protein